MHLYKIFLASGSLRIKLPSKKQSGTTMRATKGYLINGYRLIFCKASVTRTITGACIINTV